MATHFCDPDSTPTCSGIPFADSDSDGLSDCIEHSGYNTCASTSDATPGWSACATPMDSDGDGCADVLEVMDLNGDRKVTVSDQTLLAKRSVGILPASDSDPVFDVNKDGQDQRRRPDADGEEHLHSEAGANRLQRTAPARRNSGRSLTSQDGIVLTGSRRPRRGRRERKVRTSLTASTGRRILPP